MPIYPSSGLLDAFTRANENPIDSTPPNLWRQSPQYWGDPLRIISNRCAIGGPVFGGMYWVNALPASTDIETYIAVMVLPTVVGNVVSLDLFLADDINPSGYELTLLKTGGGFELYLDELVAGVRTNLDFATVNTFAAADGFLLNRLSTGVFGWVSLGGVWSQVVSGAGVTTFYGDPLLIFHGLGDGLGTVRTDFFGGGIVGSMPNLGDVTATTITVPSSLSQNTQEGYVANRLWYQYTAAADGVIGAFGYGSVSIYTPRPTVYLGPAGALTTLISTGSSAANKPVQVIVRAGLTYFFDWQPANTPNLGPAVLLLDFVAAPNAALASGQIFVNDDSPGFPAVLLSATGGGPQWFWVDAPAGEAGDILTDGRALLNEFVTNNIKLYDATVKPPTLLRTIAIDTSFAIRAQRLNNVFYVGDDSGPVGVHRLDRDGNETGSWVLTGNGNIFAIAANNEQTILYFSNRTPVGSALKRWNLTSDSALPNLVGPTTTPPYYIEDILVLMDDTLLASYVQVVFGTIEVRHYDMAGTLLATYGPYSTGTPAGTLPRLAYALDDPLSFWVWTHPTPDGTSRFQNIRVADGAVLTTFDQVEYQGGVYQLAATPSPVDRFGNSFSCPFFILSASSPPPPPGTGCPNTLTVTAVDGVGCSTTLGSSAV